jgi:hypothetical protein
MRTFVLLSLIALAAAGADMEKQGDCVVDGAEAVSDLIDSTMFIWASLERCGKKDSSEIKCEVAITSAIESVNNMINVILSAVDKCGSLNTGPHKECGKSVGRLTASVAGLAAGAGGIAEKCPKAFAHQSHTAEWSEAGSVMCVVELKHVATSLFKTIKVLMKVSKAKSNDATNGLQVVAALAGLGEFLAGAIGQCSVNLKGTKDIACGEEIARLVKDVTKVSVNGIDMHKKCEEHIKFATEVVEMQVPAPRLFLQTDQTEADQTPTISANLMLGAFLPVTAIVSFVGGRFYGNRNSEAREILSDVE